jgi:hypothetical protein
MKQPLKDSISRGLLLIFQLCIRDQWFVYNVFDKPYKLGKEEYRFHNLLFSKEKTKELPLLGNTSDNYEFGKKFINVFTKYYLYPTNSASSVKNI